MNIIESFKIKNKQRWIQRNTSQHGHLRRFNKKWCKWLKNKKNRKPKNQLNKVRKNSNGRTSSKTDVIIANANKGGAILIMNTDDYINEANHQLSDKDNYRQGLNDPTLQNNEMVNNTIERFQKISKISCQKKKKKQTAEGLKIFNPKAPKFYITSKIYKEYNPGRSIINSINCCNSEILHFLNNYFQQVV